MAAVAEQPTNPALTVRQVDNSVTSLPSDGCGLAVVELTCASQGRRVRMSAEMSELLIDDRTDFRLAASVCRHGRTNRHRHAYVVADHIVDLPTS